MNAAFREAALLGEAEQVLRKFLDEMSSFMINQVGPGVRQRKATRRLPRTGGKFLSSNADDPWQLSTIGWDYQQKRMPEKAIAKFKRAVEVTKDDSFYLAALGHAYAMAGNRREAEQILRALSDRAKKSYVSPFDLALIHAALDEKDEAFALLDKAVAERSTFLVYSKWEPRLDPLRSDPRFSRILKQVGLPAT